MSAATEVHRQGSCMIYFIRSLSVNTQVIEVCVNHTSLAGQDQTRQKILKLQLHGGPRWKVIMLMGASKCPGSPEHAVQNQCLRKLPLNSSLY